MAYHNLADLRRGLESAGNVLTVEMREVRDAFGKKRLGSNVVAEIEDSLRTLGIGHFPKSLPDSQTDLVRLYLTGTPTADIITAVLTPGRQGDDLIRRAADARNARLITQIRDLIQDPVSNPAT
jgi:hypothetical protein